MKQILLFLLMSIFSLPLFGANSREKDFWQWFQKNESRLHAFEKNQEKVFDDLSAALKKVSPDITFEFGPIEKDGRREFVVSAGGIKSAFSKVESLVAAAPILARWIVVKFRQRRSPINDLEFAGKKIRAADVHFALVRDDDPKKIGIVLFMDGYRKEADSVFGQMGYLFLDEALGEYDVEMKLGMIVFESRASKYFEKARPLSELPSAFDEHFSKRRQ